MVTRPALLQVAADSKGFPYVMAFGANFSKRRQLWVKEDRLEIACRGDGRLKLDVEFCCARVSVRDWLSPIWFLLQKSRVPTKCLCQGLVWRKTLFQKDAVLKAFAFCQVICWWRHNAGSQKLMMVTTPLGKVETAPRVLWNNFVRPDDDSLFRPPMNSPHLCFYNPWTDLWVKWNHSSTLKVYSRSLDLNLTAYLEGYFG